jgi:hypothetical protein
MTEERKILEMLSAEQININQALGLLEALRSSATDISLAKNQVKKAEDLRWLAIHCLAGDVRMLSNPVLSEPRVVEGPVLENGRLGARDYRGDIEVEVPENFGVNLDVKKGDIRAEGIAFVKGEVRFGQATLERVGGVDLLLQLGNVNATLLLTRGVHSLNFQKMLEVTS